MQRPDMQHFFHLRAARLGLALAALVLGLAVPGAQAAPTDPTGGTPDPGTSKHGGDGVGGIEKTAGKAPQPTKPTEPSGPGGHPSSAKTGAFGTEDAWSNLGGALAGSSLPVLQGLGDAAAGGTLALDLQDARPDALMTLVIGAHAMPMPFKGGTLVPTPDMLLPGLITDGSGHVLVQAVLPVSLPSDLVLVFQFWIVDPAAPHGLAASNAEALQAP